MEPFIGEIKLFAGNFAPRGFMFCHGQLLSIAEHTALFSLLGTMYGGDGRTSFGLPDLRGRVVVGAGHGPGLHSYNEGQKGGQEAVTLTTAEMPSHTHSMHAHKSRGNQGDPEGASLGDSSNRDRDFRGKGDVNTTMSANSIGNTGGGQAHENRQPFLAMNYIIAIMGIYPSRS